MVPALMVSHATTWTTINQLSTYSFISPTPQTNKPLKCSSSTYPMEVPLIVVKSALVMTVHSYYISRSELLRLSSRLVWKSWRKPSRFVTYLWFRGRLFGDAPYIARVTIFPSPTICSKTFHARWTLPPCLTVLQTSRYCTMHFL